jgi:ubiquinol-cytochrome c reductase iron-sulfur subunit
LANETQSHDSEHEYSAGLAVVQADKVADPGLEPHRVRMTDKSVKHEKAAARQVATWFLVSMIGSIAAIVFYFAIPLSYQQDNFGPLRLNTFLVGVSAALGMLAIGFGAVHWAKTLMPDAEVAEARHQTRGTEEVRARAIEIVNLANQESGFSRRKLIRRSLYGALALFPLPGLVLFKDMTTEADPSEKLRHTMWADPEHRYLTTDPFGTKIKAEDVTLGSVFHVIPNGLEALPEDQKLEAKAKAAVLLVRLDPQEIHSQKERDWGYHGIVAYSKICTHVGCPVALYEQHTHHLLCPCHQSTFDITDDCKVIFGPASRPLPQLQITVDAEGYLIAKGDFHEPVGPSFWERTAK